MLKAKNFDTVAAIEAFGKELPNLEYLIENEKVADFEPAKCKKFGCGKTLNPTETLFGNFCFNHVPTNENGSLEKILS